MKANEYLTGVYLDNRDFSKKEVIDLMDEYYNYRKLYDKQTIDKLIIILKEEARKFWIKYEENDEDREHKMFDRGIHSGLYLAIKALNRLNNNE